MCRPDSPIVLIIFLSIDISSYKPIFAKIHR